MANITGNLPKAKAQNSHSDIDATKDRLIRSYLELRCAIGCLGMGLPIVLGLGGILLHSLDIESSISAYYHTQMRDFFVGFLCAIGVFLWAYKGYDWLDNWLGDLAGASAWGVAIFPTAPPNPSTQEGFLGNIHLGCALVFFLTLAYFSLVLFTKTHSDKKQNSQNNNQKTLKQQRNDIYTICGWLIILCLVLIGVVNVLPPSISAVIHPLDPIFWLESFAVFAFGFSWFTKGQGILQDPKVQKTNTP